jgi:hypothetical protein
MFLTSSYSLFFINVHSQDWNCLASAVTIITRGKTSQDHGRTLRKKIKDDTYDKEMSENVRKCPIKKRRKEG